MFTTNTQTSIGYVNNYDKNRYQYKFWKAAVYTLGLSSSHCWIKCLHNKRTPNPTKVERKYGIHHGKSFMLQVCRTPYLRDNHIV